MARPKPAIIFIFITLFLDIFGIGVIVPVLPKLVEELQGGDLEAAAHSVGWLGALYALMQFIFSPVLGSLSDRFGRRPVILASLFGSGIDYLVLAWAPTLGWLYLARIVSGITAANFSAASAYIADVTPPEKRAAGFGMIGAAFGLGFIAGPAIGGLLGAHGLRTPFLVAAGITLLNWLYGAFVLPESLAKENRRPFTWESAHPIKALTALSRWPVVMGLAGTHFFSMLAGNIYPALWVLYTGLRYGWDSRQVGISLALVGVMAAIVQAGLAGKVIAKIGERRGVYLGLLAMAVAMFCYGAATDGWMVYVIILIGSIGGIGSPATQSMISRAVSADEQGAVQGALNSITSIAGIVAPVLWTALFSWSIAKDRAFPLPGLSFYGACAVSLAAAGLAWRAFRKAGLSSP
ncbi:TCR/Tet family MFS transporter [Luteolibacter sp. GHJ8]|uniref:TCR/Tet family MFS transporter n=1 Tax=Luteolibacter rhizosphaerae TaxID=2989719 RepID=A0ABT3G9X4_9BACT|nr:TCR/Tet family MFS transporter [Luteolibacter rhizosphaerae]MCW1916648.1 TCR/Tet family MFS transporter [Luteolibacter rhizosphaerae]